MESRLWAASAPLRILVLTRSYPAADDLYQYPFVHRRVVAYRSMGHEVAVFRHRPGSPASHRFEGVTCHSGDSTEFGSFAQQWNPDVIAAHGLSEAMWPAVEQLVRIPVFAWLHGSEIPEFFRQKALALTDPVERALAMKHVQARISFWSTMRHGRRGRPKLIVPSRSAVDLALQDLDDCLNVEDFSIIPNPIDTDLFRHVPKNPQDRFSILSIRPYDSTTYGNDLAVSTVLSLATQPNFSRFHFTFIGDGPLFDETLAPVARFSNVTIRRGFLTQGEIATEHARNGIFLVPTRLDTHGVSRDEAMASGLVPVTNAIPVTREFVDEDCAGLAEPDEFIGLAKEVSRMADDVELFLHRSGAAADRVRRHRSHKQIIPAELALLGREVVFV